MNITGKYQIFYMKIFHKLSKNIQETKNGQTMIQKHLYSINTKITAIYLNKHYFHISFFSLMLWIIFRHFLMCSCNNGLENSNLENDWSHFPQEWKTFFPSLILSVKLLNNWLYPWFNLPSTNREVIVEREGRYKNM